MERKSIFYSLIFVFLTTLAFAGQNVVGDLNVTANISAGKNINSTKNITVGNNFFIPAPTVPTSSADTGITGQFSWDGSYLYMCTATNTWERVAIATWALTRVDLMIDGIQLQIDGIDLQR